MRIRTGLTISLLLICAVLSSCHHTNDSASSCKATYKEARDLAFKSPKDTAALLRSLNIINRSFECDSIRPAVIDLKLRLLITLRKYDVAARFLDSLPSADLGFPYKKPLAKQQLIALRYASSGDSSKRDSVYQRMAADLSSYVKTGNLSSAEFQEAFAQLYELESRYMNSAALTRQVDSMLLAYPAEEKYLDFFRR